MLHVVANSKTEKQDSCFQGRGQELSCPAALMNQFMSLIVNDLKARSEEGHYHPLALHQHHLPSEIIQQTSVKRQASTAVHDLKNKSVNNGVCQVSHYWSSDLLKPLFVAIM